MRTAVRLLAVASMVAAPAVAVPAAPAAAQGTQCVALVVDRAPGSYTTGCVTWSAGLTGAGVLTRAGHSVAYRPDGLICKIDDYPAGSCRADATHYWSYWHRPAGGSGWSYSTSSANAYQPPVNSSEGWAYQDGASRRPAGVSFATICPPPAPSPPRTTAPRQPPAVTTPAPAPAPAPERSTAVRATGGASIATSGRTGAGATTRPATSRPAPSPSVASPGAASPGAASPNAAGSAAGDPGTSPPATAGPTLAEPAADSGAAGTPAAALAVLALIGGIGAAAWFTSRHRARSG